MNSGKFRGSHVHRIQFKIEIHTINKANQKSSQDVDWGL